MKPNHHVWANTYAFQLLLCWFRRYFICTNIVAALCTKTFRENWDSNVPSIGIWNSLGLFRDYGLNYILFWNKTGFFSRYKAETQFEKEFQDTYQNFNSFSHFLFPFFPFIVWLSWNIVRFHKIIFQIYAKIFSFLSWKTKKFYS